MEMVPGEGGSSLECFGVVGVAKYFRKQKLMDKLHVTYVCAFGM